MKLKCLPLLLCLLVAVSIAAQDKAPVSQRVDSFGKQTSEERSFKFDIFVNQLNNFPNSKGYVFVYCGKSCRYGEVESHFRGIELKIAGRIERSRITVVHGGYRDSQEVELWMQPAGASAPTATSTVNIKNVTFTKAITKIVEPYDCCESVEAQWKTFKPTN